MGILCGNGSHRSTCTVEGKQSGEIDHTGARGSNTGGKDKTILYDWNRNKI
jgi:hypothetical protein